MCRYWTWTGVHEQTKEEEGKEGEEKHSSKEEKKDDQQEEDKEERGGRNCYLKVEKGATHERPGSISGSTPRACADNEEIMASMKAGMEEEAEESGAGGRGESAKWTYREG